jgi:hypothetical protein
MMTKGLCLRKLSNRYRLEIYSETSIKLVCQHPSITDKVAPYIPFCLKLPHGMSETDQSKSPGRVPGRLPEDKTQAIVFISNQLYILYVSAFIYFMLSNDFIERYPNRILVLSCYEPLKHP